MFRAGRLLRPPGAAPAGARPRRAARQHRGVGSGERADASHGAAIPVALSRRSAQRRRPRHGPGRSTGFGAGRLGHLAQHQDRRGGRAGRLVAVGGPEGGLSFVGDAGRPARLDRARGRTSARRRGDGVRRQRLRPDGLALRRRARHARLPPESGRVADARDGMAPRRNGDGAWPHGPRPRRTSRERTDRCPEEVGTV